MMLVKEGRKRREVLKKKKKEKTSPNLPPNNNNYTVANPTRKTVLYLVAVAWSIWACKQFSLIMRQVPR